MRDRGGGAAKAVPLPPSHRSGMGCLSGTPSAAQRTRGVSRALVGGGNVPGDRGAPDRPVGAAATPGPGGRGIAWG